MRDYMKEASTVALASVRRAEMARDALAYVRSVIDDDNYRLGTQLSEAIKLVEYAVGMAELKAHQRHFAIAAIDPRQQDAARELAMRRFFHQRASIMGLVGDEGSWMVGEEAEFRDQVKAMIESES